MEIAPILPSPRQRARRVRPNTSGRVITYGSGATAQRRRPKPAGLALWWPTLVGMALGFVAPRLWQYIQSAWSQLGPLCVFPYLFLCGRPELGIGQKLAANLSQLMLYLQFPLEGMIATWVVSKGSRQTKALGQVALVHGLGIFVLWLLSKQLLPH